MNTSAYHPQSDGVVERFNRTLTDMLAKCVVLGTREWDNRLPYVLFAYRASVQVSTGESPFFLVYGSDLQLPTEVTPLDNHDLVGLDNYKSVILQEMSVAVTKAQKQQKRQHDSASKNVSFVVGERVFLCMPALKMGAHCKLSCPFKAPY